MKEQQSCTTQSHQNSYCLHHGKLEQTEPHVQVTKSPDQSKISADQFSSFHLIEMQCSTKCDPEIVLSSGFVYLLQQVHSQNTTHDQTKKTMHR